MRLHGRRSLLHHRLHSPPVRLQARRSLLLYLRLQVRAEWHLTVLLVAALGVIPTEEDDLLAHVTLTILPLAFFRMLYDTFITETTTIDAVGIPAVHRVQQRFDAALHGLLPLQLRTGERLVITIQRVVFTIVADVDYRRRRAFHSVLVLRAVGVAFLAQIEVITHCTVIADLALLPASVAVVGELVRRRRVQFVEQRHRRELGATQRREFVVLITSEVEESITRVHEITLNQRVSIVDRRT